MMFGQHFKHFFKNRKKSILKIFFRICINKIGRILIFRPEIGQKNLELEKTYPSPFQKNFLPLIRTQVDFQHYFCSGVPFSRFSILLRLGHFGHKKLHIYIKFYFFQNLQNLSFLSIYTLLGKFSARKKIWRFEITSNPFQLPLDDSIICIYMYLWGTIEYHF